MNKKTLQSEMKITSLEQRLKDPKYKLWIKAVSCLFILKEGIEQFADERSKIVHDFVKMAVANTNSKDKICPNANTDLIIGKGTLGCCLDCYAYVTEIIKYSKEGFKFTKSNWRNSDPQYWPRKPWEMVKVYMNTGQKNFQKQPSSKTTDLSGLLNFIDHCSVPWVDIQNKDNIPNVRDARNAIMHSASMKISHADFLEYTKTMINLLNDPLFMNKSQEAQDAVKAIQEIEEMGINISPEHEYKVIKEKTMSIEEQNETLREEVSSLKDRCGQIKGLLDKETGKREEDVEVLKKEINKKESQIKELTTELLLLRKLIMEDHDLLRKMDVQMLIIETALDTTSTEFKQLKQLMEQKDTQSDKQGIKQLLSEANGDVEFQNLRKENETLRENQLRLQEENENLRTMNEELKRDISTLARSNTDMHSIIKQQAQENENDSNETIRKLREENQHLVNERKGTKEIESKNECTNEKCREKLEALEFQTENLKSEIKSIRSRFKDNSGDLDKSFEKTKDVLFSKIIEDSEERQELKTAIKTLENNLAAEIKRSDCLEYQLDKLKEEKQTLLSKKQRQLEKFNQETEKEMKELNETIRQLREEVQHSENKTDNLKRAKEELENDLTAEKNRSENQFYIFNEEKETFISEKRELERFSQEKENEIKDLNETLKKLRVEIQHLETEIKKQKGVIEELEYDLSAEKNISRNHVQQLHTFDEEKETLLSEKRKEIISLRTQIDTDKDKYEQDLTKSKDEIQKLISGTKTLQEKIESDSNSSKNYRVQKEAEIENLNSEKKRLEDLLSQKDAEIRELLEETRSFKASESSRGATRQETDVVIAKQVSTRLSDDNNKALISGAMFLSEGDLVVCDGGNKKIKVFSRIFDMKSSLLLESKPWDLAELSRNLLAVTLPDTKQLIYLEVHPILQKTKALKLDKMCWGIAVSENDLYVTHFNKQGEVGVIILDIDGHEKKSINAHSDTFFVNPEYLAVSIGGLIHVSDKDLNSVTIIDSEGSIIRHYKEPDLEKPGGICFDHSGNFIICGTSSNNLHIVSTDGRKLKIVRTQENLLCVAYRKDNMLVIGCDNDELLVLKLEDSWQKKIE